ncbi:MAG: hypothetical protein RLZZ553_254 [Verrucomicrobiota bacterium]|jgi:uncharacterized protein YyaL (SSP411 family)
MPNALIHESSPYLLQHANNPVDWLPWSEESFARATRENKPVFLSIGYSTCHWCHVMEHESFENELTAELMNASFINIKVDREEMPDIDATYMAFIQATTGQGGWPMSVWLTPQGEPLLGGTYFPPEDRYGRAGFPRILREVARLWSEDETKMRATGASMLARLQQDAAAMNAQPHIAEARAFGDFFDHCDRQFDEELGGFGMAPKFPRPVVLQTLMQLIDRWGAAHPDSQRAWQMIDRTLKAMISGGIHDQLAGGFHRYSVDRYWHVPHYEKMLYDQALILDALLDAWQLSGDPFYEGCIITTIAYLLEYMRDESGAFHAAEDADSLPFNGADHKREGAFWTWEASEISRLLDPRSAMVFSVAYGVEADGNARPESDPHEELAGQNTLFLAMDSATLGLRFDLSEVEINTILHAAKKILLEKRMMRPQPHRDDKIITAWNGMVIRALARAARIFSRHDWRDAAMNAAHFLLRELWDGTTLYRCFRGKRSSHPGTPADHAHLVSAFIELHQIDPGSDWLSLATQIQRALDECFWSHDQQGYVLRSTLQGRELLAVREDYDGAEPSPNHLAAVNLLRLATLVDEPTYHTRAEALLRGGTTTLQQHPFAAPVLLSALDLWERGVTHWQVPHHDQNNLSGYRPRAVFTFDAITTETLICEQQTCRTYDASIDAVTLIR